VRKTPSPSPRNVTADHGEVDALIDHAPAHLRLWILLCSDLAIRSGTASALSPRHYHQHAGTLEFTTKYQERATLPVTDAVRELIEACDQTADIPFVRQLWTQNHTGRRLQPEAKHRSFNVTLHIQFQQLLKSAGITRRITPHDLRRTTAVAMLDYTKDVRAVQALLTHKRLTSTIWYLDHNLRPVQRQTLEFIKRPPAQKEERTA
jgi:integrase